MIPLDDHSKYVFHLPVSVQKHFSCIEVSTSSFMSLAFLGFYKSDGFYTHKLLQSLFQVIAALYPLTKVD